MITRFKLWLYSKRFFLSLNVCLSLLEMLIHIDILIEDIVLDLILAHLLILLFCSQILSGVKMLLFSEFIITLLCTLTMIKKDILVLDEVLTQGLDNNMIIAKAKYSINFSKLQSKFCLSHPYNGSNIFFVNASKTFQFKTKDFEIKPYPLCLGIISKYFSVNNMIKTRWNGYMSMIFLLIIILLLLLILLIFINISWKTLSKLMFGFIKKSLLDLIVCLIVSFGG